MEEEARGASEGGKAKATGDHGGDISYLVQWWLLLNIKRSGRICVCSVYQRLACYFEVANEHWRSYTSSTTDGLYSTLKSGTVYKYSTGCTLTVH